MFNPDPGSEFFHPGSSDKKIPGSATKNLSIFNLSEFFHPGSRVKKIPDPGSESASTNLSIFNPNNYF